MYYFVNNKIGVAVTSLIIMFFKYEFACHRIITIVSIIDDILHVCFGCRKYSCGSCKVVKLPFWKTSSTGLSNLKPSRCKREISSRCSCLGALVDPDGATASGLVSISDQLLLMASIALTYMAGVIPTDRPNLNSWRNMADDNVVHETAASSGR